MDLEIIENIDNKNDQRKYFINKLEDLHEVGNYSAIDRIIKDFVNYAFDFDMYLTFLISTYRYAKKLKNINILFNKTIKFDDNKNEFLMKRYKPHGFDEWVVIENRKQKIKRLVRNNK